MTIGVPTCKLDAPVADIARFLIDNNVEEMVVLGDEGEGVGVVGYEELVSAYHRENIRELTAEEVMREGVPELPSDIPLTVAAQMMKDKKIRVAYMNHNSAGIIYPAAMISYRHIVRHLAEFRRHHLSRRHDLVQAHRPPPGRERRERTKRSRPRGGKKITC